MKTLMSIVAILLLGGCGDILKDNNVSVNDPLGLSPSEVTSVVEANTSILISDYLDFTTREDFQDTSNNKIQETMYIDSPNERILYQFSSTNLGARLNTIGLIKFTQYDSYYEISSFDTLKFKVPLSPDVGTRYRNNKGETLRIDDVNLSTNQGDFNDVLEMKFIYEYKGISFVKSFYIHKTLGLLQIETNNIVVSEKAL